VLDGLLEMVRTSTYGLTTRFLSRMLLRFYLLGCLSQIL